MAGRTYTILGPCTVYINSVGLHYDRGSWGPDAHTFRPSRWLIPGTDTAEQRLITPERGTFVPWSGGPRVCPGQKMSQVEFVTVISTLFERLRVEPATQRGQGREETREHFQGTHAGQLDAADPEHEPARGVQAAVDGAVGPTLSDALPSATDLVDRPEGAKVLPGCGFTMRRCCGGGSWVLRPDWPSHPLSYLALRAAPLFSFNKNNFILSRSSRASFCCRLHLIWSTVGSVICGKGLPIAP